MTINKKFIEKFNKNKSLDLYRDIYSTFIVEKNHCKSGDFISKNRDSKINQIIPDVTSEIQ